MDVKGAEALKKRLGSKLTESTPSASADVPEGAPPVYHWLGVSKKPDDAPPLGLDDEPAPSFFRRLGLSFR